MLLSLLALTGSVLLPWCPTSIGLFTCTQAFCYDVSNSFSSILTFLLFLQGGTKIAFPIPFFQTYGDTVDGHPAEQFVAKHRVRGLILVELVFQL